MAVPTITSVTPNAITTQGGGELVIEGTNFKIPADPLSGPGPIPWPTPELAQGVTVRLYSESPDPAWSYTFPAAKVASTTKVKVDVPALPLPRSPTDGKVVPSLTLKVELKNLDDAETAIPGEEVVFSSLKLRRPLLAGPDANSLTNAVTRSLVDLLEMICPNVSVIPNVDWDDDISTAWIDQAKQPSLVVVGPFIVKSTGGRSGFEAFVTNPSDTTFKQTHPLETYDYDYRILGISNSATELQNLIGAVLNSVMRYRSLTVYANALNKDPANSLTFDMSFPRPPSVETQIQSLNSNLRLFKADLAVHSVPAAGVDSFLDDAITESGGVLGSGSSTECPGDAEHVSSSTGVEICLSDLD